MRWPPSISSSMPSLTFCDLGAESSIGRASSATHPRASRQGLRQNAERRVKDRGRVMSPNVAPPEILSLPDGSRLAYRRLIGRAGDGRPGIVFLPGFASDMTATKGTALAAWAQERGQALLRFDYSGHGQSSGAFRDGTIG